MAQTAPAPQTDEQLTVNDIRADSALSEAARETVIRHGNGEDTFSVYTAEARFMRQAVMSDEITVEDVQRDDAGYVVALTARGPARRMVLLGRR